MLQSNQIEAEAKAKRLSQVQEQMNSLDGSLAVLHDSIGKLTDRLSSVLRSSVPSEVVERDKERSELVNLACTIEGFGDSVRLTNYKIKDILERLEL